MILLVLIVVDQITKELIPRDFLVPNYGLSFGQDFGSYNKIILIVSAIVLIAVSYLNKHNLSRWEKLGLTAIAAGAISNIVDRIFFGYVRDYIPFWFATFNLADLYILAGIVLMWFKSKQN